MSDAPKPPAGLKARGKALWAAVLERLDLDLQELLLLTEAARCADRLDALDRIIRRDGPMAGDKPSGAMVEARQQGVLLARLIASLRLPEDLENPQGRPQRRGAARGTYQGGGR